MNVIGSGLSRPMLSLDEVYYRGISNVVDDVMLVHVLVVFGRRSDDVSMT